LIGKILGNRYRLIELIGEGGMALVYKAECSLLCRTVAVKILRPQYASDAEFVERFRREARSAASLNHPHVVSIYDVGQENDGTDYIVMEYIPGDNLKDMIKKEAPFSIRKALDYTKQIAEALNHAHQRNIIHRDIKPHNILVTPDGQLKVTDFGIARAISASSFTQAGIVVGSVQYASPEQVKAGLVGPQSDIYSLGCVLYELLTGTVPFNGDTSISIAMQHLHEKTIPVRESRPDIPVVVENILDKAMAKDPAQRYPSAAAMLRDIANAQGKPGMEAETVEDLPTQVWSSIPDPEKPKRKLNSWFSKTMIGLGIGMTLIFIGIMIFMAYPPKPEVVVPNLIGKDLMEARELLNQQNLNLKITNQLFNSEYPVNRIISQRPPAGQKKKVNTEIEVIVSKGPSLVRVPNLLGKTKTEAEMALEELGLKLGEVVASYVEGTPEGAVIKQLPEENTQIEQGASVSITINSMETGNVVNVPNFIGKSLSEVRAELGSIGLIYNGATLAPSNVYAEGLVIDQNPAPYGKVPMGTAMSFIVSSGSQ
jgi:serine/threonine protein kinase